MVTDFSYIEPRNVKQLHEGALIKALTEYREAARVLYHCHIPEETGFNQQLNRAALEIEIELKRRRKSEIDT